MSPIHLPDKRAYMTSADAGDLVFGLLSESDATLAEGCEQLGITPEQFRSGLAYVKDVLAGGNGTPVVYDPRTYRYSLALLYAHGADKVKEYEVYRLRCVKRTLQRLRTGTAAPAARMTKSNTVRRFLRHLEGACEELDILLDELAPARRDDSHG